MAYEMLYIYVHNNKYFVFKSIASKSNIGVAFSSFLIMEVFIVLLYKLERQRKLPALEESLYFGAIDQLRLGEPLILGVSRLNSLPNANQTADSDFVIIDTISWRRSNGNRLP